MKVFCTTCGAPMEADERHCRRCGRLQTGPMLVRAVGRAEEPAPDAQEVSASSEPPRDQARKRFDPVMLLLGAVALLLVIFAVGLAIGRLSASGGGPSAATGRPAGQQAPAVVTPTPSSSPSARPTPTSAAHFVSTNWSIPGSRCTSTNGCPIRNQGPGRGEGTARFEVTSEDGATVYASCTAPISATDPGATAQASCSANSPELVNLWHQDPGAQITVKVNVA
jgi:predicted nucleic acid-binding Zn ribbon protein